MNGRVLCRALIVVALPALSSACRDERKADLSKDEVAALMGEYEKARAAEAKRQQAESSPSLTGSARAAPPPATPAPSTAPEPAEPPPAASVSVVGPKGDIQPEGPWIADEPEPIGPAGPGTATVDGVVMRAKTDELFVARLSTLSRSPKATKTPITKVPKSAGTFPLGPGPGVAGGYAYWVSNGKLRRQKLPTREGTSGPRETLADDALTGTRVATPIDVPGLEPEPIPGAVAYIVRPEPTGKARPGGDEDPAMLGKLWVEGHDPLLLTPEGTATHAVQLVRQRDGLLAISMHKRMAMTPVHARRITFPGGKPKAAEDLVVWVGGGVQPHSELSLLPGPEQGLWGFVAHEHSITEFGIAELTIGQRPDQNTPTRWLFYPNGIDPAPLDVGYLCGEPVVVHAQPRHAEPDAPQQLVLRSLLDSANKAQELARAGAFYSVSFASLPRGALVSWVSDWVTWARTVRCRKT